MFAASSEALELEWWMLEGSANASTETTWLVVWASLRWHQQEWCLLHFLLRRNRGRQDSVGGNHAPVSHYRCRLCSGNHGRSNGCLGVEGRLGQVSKAVLGPRGGNPLPHPQATSTGTIPLETLSFLLAHDTKLWPAWVQRSLVMLAILDMLHIRP